MSGMMNAIPLVRLLAVALAVAIGGWLGLASRAPERSASRPEGPSVSPHAAVGATLPLHGAAIQIHTADDAVRRYGRLIDELADLGADSVLLSVNGYQEHVDSTRIFVKASVTPTDEELATLIGQAHRRGLRVILMPKILLSNPRGSNWRGKIQPPSWDAWFEQYRAFILRYAALAEGCGVEVFLVGSELISTEHLTAQWRETIGAVREVYAGLLGYSANWDHYTAVQFWDALDLLGMTTYYQLADEPGPTTEALTARWRDLRKKILDYQADIDRPLLFTEVGWCSQEGCSVEAWNYYRSTTVTPAALEEQRRNYRAFIDTWQDDPAVGGVIWWEWTEEPGGPEDCGYSPRGKPAERELRAFFRAVGEGRAARD